MPGLTLASMNNISMFHGKNVANISRVFKLSLKHVSNGFPVAFPWEIYKTNYKKGEQYARFLIGSMVSSLLSLTEQLVLVDPSCRFCLMAKKYPSFRYGKHFAIIKGIGGPGQNFQFLMF